MGTMKALAIQNAILAHLKSVGRPETSRDLAARFLRIENADEGTCRRLLAPFLLTVPGLVHRPGDGWSIAIPQPRGASRPSEEPSPEPSPAPAADLGSPAPAPLAAATPLSSFVALASDGSGPRGSGAARLVSLLPVIDGEECQAEHLPTWFAIEDAPPPEGAPGLGEDELRALIETVGDLPVVCHRAGREVEPIRRACVEAGLTFTAPVVSLSRLGHLLLGLKPSHATLDLASALSITVRGPDDCRGRVAIVATAYAKLIEKLLERGIDSLEALLEYQDMPAAPLDLSPYAFTAEDLRALPARPGVYRFLSRTGEVIYVGKSRNLRSRVSSYFIPSARGTAKGRAILEQVRSFLVEEVASDLEAVLLEAAWISEHRPGLNRQFEVRERPAPYGPRLNLVVVLGDAVSSAGRRTCTLHLLRAGRYVGRVREVVAPHADRAGWKDATWRRTVSRITSAYFPGAGEDRVESGRVTAKDAREDRGAEVDWQLVSSYLRKHRDEVNVLDVDECPSAGDAEGKLRVLVEATSAGLERVVAR
jgi:GIY-YIG catalytic domain-containing protein